MSKTEEGEENPAGERAEEEEATELWGRGEVMEGMKGPEEAETEAELGSESWERNGGRKGRGRRGAESGGT